MLDALLTLNAPPPAPGAVHPALMVALKGALPAPKRTVDTNLLTSWLTLRALEQQSRQIDAMEKAAREAAPPRPPRRRSPPNPRTPSVVPESAPAVPAPNATNGNFGGRSSAGAAAADHDTGGAEAARRATGRQRGAGARRASLGQPGLLGAQN